MARIEVVRVPSTPGGDAFRVIVDEDDGSTQHSVSVAAPPPGAAGRYPSLEAFVTAAFVFLLEREPKESILASFEIREIGRYFPEWETELAAG